jgi:penicillin-binding protein 2
MKLPWRKSRPRQQQPLLTEGLQRLSFSRRAVVLSAAQFGIGGILAARMGYISVIDSERYKLKAESNRVNLTLIPPRRGWIIDRYGKALADNRVALRVDIIPDRLQNKERVLERLTSILSLDADSVDRIRRQIESSAGAQPVEIAANLNEELFAAVSVNLPDLPGVVPARGFIRNYPTGPSVAHLVGYVGSASAEDYARERDPLMLTPGFKVGKDGLEKYYDRALRGRPGARRAEVTARGRLVRELETQSDGPGDTLQLTIDADLQDYAARRLGLESGAVVVIDCLTGGILSLVSMPAFDPNSFTDGIGRLEWQMLQDDYRIPLLNKAMRGLYPPGSTMKPMAGLALQQHGIDPAERVVCGGGYRLGSRYFRCDAVHGAMDLPSAIEHSCNTYFWSMAHRVGYDVIAPTARLLGLGQEFDLPGTSQRYGTIPDAAWKRRRYNQEWSGADSLNASIGQGYVSVSPLQLAVMVSRIASGRNLLPSLLLGQPKTDGPRLPFSAEQLAVVREGMRRVVNGSGTAAGVRLDVGGVRMAGKTGTAQVRALQSRGVGGAWKSRDHALFVCYAPVEDPRYAVAVVIEHGTFGARAAAPVARDTLTFLYDRDRALTQLAALEAGWGGTPTDRLARSYAAIRNASVGAAPVPPEDATATTGPADGNGR